MDREVEAPVAGTRAPVSDVVAADDLIACRGSDVPGLVLECGVGGRRSDLEAVTDDLEDGGGVQGRAMLQQVLRFLAAE
jgi:hypothetical protein